MAPKSKPENEVLQENNCFQAANNSWGGTAIMSLRNARTLALEELMHLNEQGLGSRREYRRCGKCFSVQDSVTWFKGNILIHLYA